MPLFTFCSSGDYLYQHAFIHSTTYKASETKSNPRLKIKQKFLIEFDNKYSANRYCGRVIGRVGRMSVAVFWLLWFP